VETILRIEAKTEVDLQLFPDTLRGVPEGDALYRAVLWHGPVLELSDRARLRLGPDILARPPDLDAMLANLRALPQGMRAGEALQSQRAVAGIGNMWMSEALFDARVSPWLTLGEATDSELREALAAAARLARPARWRAGRPPRLPAQAQAVSPLRRDRPLVASRRRRPHGVLVPGLSKRRSKRRGPRRAVTNRVAVRAPQLYRSLRGFALGAFRVFVDEDLPFAFEGHESLGRPALYEYRPLVRTFLESHASELGKREDARVAIEDLQREAAARIFARAHAGPRASEEDALFRTVVMPLLVATAEACGGFDWDDAAFNHAYAELERSLFGKGHAYAAVAPLIGISVGTVIDLGDGLRVRNAATGELAAHWPEAQGLLPPDFGRETDRLAVLELERDLRKGEPEPPDAPGELADAVTAMRLVTAGPVAAGPVLFERLDWRPYGIRPVLPIASTQPDGEPTRLDEFRGRLAADIRGRLLEADEDQQLGEALDRWELSLFQADPFRAEQLRESLTYLLGGRDGLWAASVRAAVLLGESAEERGRLLELLRAGSPPPDLVRRALVEAVLHADRAKLLRTLDDSLVGLAPPPAGYFALRAAS